jgi:hypothetical protein
LGDEEYIYITLKYLYLKTFKERIEPSNFVWQTCALLVHLWTFEIKFTKPIKFNLSEFHLNKHDSVLASIALHKNTLLDSFDFLVPRCPRYYPGI